MEGEGRRCEPNALANGTGRQSGRTLLDEQAIDRQTMLMSESTQGLDCSVRIHSETIFRIISKCQCQAALVQSFFEVQCRVTASQRWWASSRQFGENLILRTFLRSGFHEYFRCGLSSPPSPIVLRAMSATRSRPIAALTSGAIIGTLGGLIGLGGAEFRLPLLLSLFRFPPLEAIILNKATSLIVVASALAFRTKSIPVADVLAHGEVVINLLVGSLLGAWLGASWATRMHGTALSKMIAVLLVAIAAVLLFGHGLAADASPAFDGWQLWVAGACAGLIIGVVASLLGVAGGELLIPTLVLLFGIDVKLAGSLSLAVSLPTMLVGFARYSRDRSFTVLVQHKAFLAWIAMGSVLGAFIGARLLSYTSPAVLIPLLTVILVVSAFKVWRHA